MRHDDRLTPAFSALDEADQTVQRLHAGCCQPLRSPRMEALAETLSSARRRLEQIDGDPTAAETVIEILENAGSQLGHLQVGCCAPGRMELYASTLTSLMKAQRAINRSLSPEH